MRISASLRDILLPVTTSIDKISVYWIHFSLVHTYININASFVSNLNRVDDIPRIANKLRIVTVYRNIALIYLCFSQY